LLPVPRLLETGKRIADGQVRVRPVLVILTDDQDPRTYEVCSTFTISQSFPSPARARSRPSSLDSPQTWIAFSGPRAREPQRRYAGRAHGIPRLAEAAAQIPGGEGRPVASRRGPGRAGHAATLRGAGDRAGGPQRRGGADRSCGARRGRPAASGQPGRPGPSAQGSRRSSVRPDGPGRARPNCRGRGGAPARRQEAAVARVAHLAGPLRR
jgi:hypothetical protein